MRKIIFCICVIFLAAGCGKQSLSVKSPDGNVAVDFKLENGNPLYSVSFKGKTVVQPSGLGLEFVENGLLSGNVEITATKDSSIDETYKVYAGKTNQSRNHCNEITICLKEKSAPGRSYCLKFRAYDDGIAFRYEVPNQKEITSYDLKQERSQFRFEAGTQYWFQHLDGFASGYEKKYLKDSIEKLDEQSIVGLPLTFEMNNGVFGSLVEADLFDYAGMYVQKDMNDKQALVSLIAPRLDDKNICVKAKDKLVTPWRAIMLAERPVDLISSDLVKNLNPACTIEDVSWIKPGLCAWDWWCYQVIPKDAKFKKGMNTETMKYYIDFASEYNLPYMLIDAGWYGDFEKASTSLTQTIPGFDIHELVSYGNKKNVGIILWVNCYSFREQMDTTLKTFEKWGVKGFKVDFMSTDDQQMVDFYNTTAIKAAKYHQMVDFHGAYKPTGMERTWPNVMTREGIMGLENSKAGMEPTPIHNVTIPFTRMISGPMDYTPGGFLNVNRDSYVVYHEPPTVLGTRTQQLAMYVVYESPWQMVSDWPGAYREAKESEFLKVVPASWDKTVGVDGVIGDNIVLARKSGDNWFLGAMCGWRDHIDQDIPSSCLINDEGKAGGLTGKYFLGMKFEKEIKTQTDASLRFNWGLKGPEGLPDDFYSIKWSGKIKVDKTGDYKLIGASDDGIRVWFDNKLIINEWRKQAAFDRYAKVHLEAGKEYPIKIDYFEQDGGAQFRLTWIPPAEQAATQDWVYRKKTINLDFLDDGAEYDATIYKDCPKTVDDPRIVEIENKKVKKGDSFTIEMAEGGGMAVCFKKSK
jgi:alpha-glucosidase